MTPNLEYRSATYMTNNGHPFALNPKLGKVFTMDNHRFLDDISVSVFQGLAPTHLKWPCSTQVGRWQANSLGNMLGSSILIATGSIQSNSKIVYTYTLSAGKNDMSFQCLKFHDVPRKQKAWPARAHPSTTCPRCCACKSYLLGVKRTAP